MGTEAFAAATIFPPGCWGIGRQMKGIILALGFGQELMTGHGARWGQRLLVEIYILGALGDLGGREESGLRGG